MFDSPRSNTFALALLCSLSALGCGASDGSSGPPASQGYEEVEIIRDLFGVGHVVAKTDLGAYFGAGYVAAEDRFFQMSWRRIMFQGRTAEFFGRGTVTEDAAGTTDVNVENDFRMRTLGVARYAHRVFPTLDREMQEMLVAYADGVNAYLEDEQARFSPLFAKHGVPIEPWTPEDCIGVWYSFMQHFSGRPEKSEAKNYYLYKRYLESGLTPEQAVAKMSGIVVIDEDAAVVQEEDVPWETRQEMEEFAAAYGLVAGNNTNGATDAHFSQAWAVSGSQTADGQALLVGDPRIPVFAPNHLYEWGMQGATFQATGAGLAGSPNLLVGHAKEVAWSVTALGMDQGDLFRLRLDPIQKPGKYELDGQWVDFEVDAREELLLKDPAGGAPTVLLTVAHQMTYWGPIVTAITAGVENQDSYAARIVPLAEVGQDTSRGFLDMIRATDTRSLYAAAESWTFPSANLIMADSSGGIAYGIVGAFPIRRPSLPMAGNIAADGSNSLNGWRAMLPTKLRPHVFNPSRGVLLSANHMPVGEWYPIPVRFGSNSNGDGLRSRRLRELLTSQTGVLTEADVFGIHHDAVNIARRDLVELGLWLRDHQVTFPLGTNASRALLHLEGWWMKGATMDNRHYATALAQTMTLMFRTSTAGAIADEFGGGENGLVLFLDDALAKIHATPPVDLPVNYAGFVRRVLQNAYIETIANHGQPADWETSFDLNELTYEMEAWTSIDGAPSLDPGNLIVANIPSRDGATMASPLGQSFTQLVALRELDSGKSSMPPGNSEHSEDFTAQLSLWELEQFKAAPLTVPGLEQSGIRTRQIVLYKQE